MVLSGFVDNESTKTRSGQISAGVKGVKLIKNSLVVKSLTLKINAVQVIPVLDCRAPIVMRIALKINSHTLPDLRLTD